MAQTRTLKDFKTLKTHDHKVTKTVFVKDLIVGDHPISLKILKDLSSKSESSKEEVKWIHQFDFLSPFHSFSLDGIRGEAGKLMKELYPTLELAEGSDPSKFYKDGDFKEFGGRVKPHEIPTDERFFMQKPWKINSKNFWGEIADYENLAHHHVKGLINKISKLETNTLGTRENWQIELSDGIAYQCENLWITTTPSKFINLFDKTQSNFFTAQFYQFSKATEGLIPLAVKFKLKSEITAERGTLFIPQSQTHEWGSFIIELDNELHLTALLFMNEAESDHEEISKKIKLLKRVLDRIFDGFEKKIVNEAISFAQTTISFTVKDDLHGLSDFIPNLQIISELGFIPLKNEQINSLQGLSRLIYLYKQSSI